MASNNTPNRKRNNQGTVKKDPKVSRFFYTNSRNNHYPRSRISRKDIEGSKLHVMWFRLKNSFKPENMFHYWTSHKGRVMFLKLLSACILIGIIGTAVLLVSIQKNLPAIRSLYGKNLGGSISYYDRTGKVLLWTDFNAIDRVPVSQHQMSPYIRNATVAIEDKKFYTEGPIDYLGILRSAVHDLLHPGGQLEGGSTITQQLVKLNENWTGRMTIPRKVKEVILAYDVSHKFSKPTILTGYLNIVPYGGIVYGIQAAAQDYFHENASQLTLAQSAFLAAIPQSPAYYSPYSPNFSASAENGRKNYILQLMQQQGYITKSQREAARTVNVLAEVQPEQGLYSNIKYPYFVTAAKQQLQNQLGTKTALEGGWKVITTLSIPQQNEAQKLVASNYSNVVNDGGDEEAMVVENAPTGQVTAMVGGTNFYSPIAGQINYATLRINPGSTYKLYDYTALINDNNAGAGSVLYDIQQPLPGYPCTNKALPLNGGNCLYDYDFQYPGPLTLRYALAGSRNVPAVKAALINGEAKTIALSKAMGLTSGYKCYANSAKTIATTCYGSAAIGEGGYLKLNESVNGFATDARLGNYIPQTMILSVTNANGQQIYKWSPPKPQQVVKPDAAYIIDNILSDPNASYLPGSCSATNCTPTSSFGWKFQHTNGWDVAIKTGTTHNDETGLMMAMTTQYVVGSWVGYHTATKPLIPHYGGLEGVTEPLTRGMITYLTNNQKPINWQQPPGIKRLPAYVVDYPPASVLGHYYGWVYPSPSTDIYPSWYVPPTTNNGSYKIDIVSGRLATSCTPSLAIKYIGSYGNAANFSIDKFVTGQINNLSGQYDLTQTDNIHNCGDQKPTVNILPNTATCTNGACSIGVSVTQGTYPLSSTKFPMQLHLIIAGKTVPSSCSLTPAVTQTNPPNTASGTCSFNYTNSGVQQIQAEVIDSVLYSTTSAAVSITTN